MRRHLQQILLRRIGWCPLCSRSVEIPPSLRAHSGVDVSGYRRALSDPGKERTMRYVG